MKHAELFSLFGTHRSVYSGKHLFIGSLYSLGTEAGDICDFSDGFSKSRVVIAGAAIPKTLENTSSSLILETVRQGRFEQKRREMFCGI